MIGPNILVVLFVLN